MKYTILLLYLFSIFNHAIAMNNNQEKQAKYISLIFKLGQLMETPSYLYESNASIIPGLFTNPSEKIEWLKLNPENLYHRIEQSKAFIRFNLENFVYCNEDCKKNGEEVIKRIMNFDAEFE